MGDLDWTIAEPGAWELDSAHFPTPISPYHASILKTQFPRGFAEGAARVGLLLSHFDHAIVNGFDYIAPRVVGAPKAAKGPPPFVVFKLLTWLHPEIRRRLATAAAVFETRPWREDVRRFETEARPASTRTHLALQAEAPADKDDRELADLLVRLRENAEHQYYLHHRFTVSALLPVGDFLAQAGDWTGLDPATLLQACRRPGPAADTGLLAAAARAVREDRGALAALGGASPAADTLAALRSSGAGRAVGEWLEHAGLRLVTGYDIVDLTAIELPDLLVRTLRAAVDEARAVDTRAAQAERAAVVRDAVPAAHRVTFDALLEEALSVSGLREERALVFDFWAYGLVRRAVREAGRRLAAKGRIEEPDHLFDASHEEMLSLLRAAEGPSRAELAERHRYRRSTTSDVAPARIGLPPSGPPPLDWMPAATRRMSRAMDAAVGALFQEPDPRSEASIVRGLSASAGVYEGRARLVLGPEDFARIEAGDVLVARMTTEAYNGLLPLLGAAVTDRGGLLCHTATVAREFGIPAVVGTREATRRIPDGARVRVDGARGEARVLG